MRGYDHTEIEKRAQEKWASLKLYEPDLKDETKEKYYLLAEFPYPSGDLHIGHWYAFAVTDIFARFKRMQGKNVLFPIGFDAFGLPAENAAIKHNLDPKEWTYKNMERMRSQLASMGASFDWSREIATCDPEYYKWTQWLFIKLMEHGLAYRAESTVKWCPKDQTVLANEQVIDGCCERCGTVVEEKRLTQWFLKITEYAERLLTDLDSLPWREEIKEAQRAWIGRSEGAKISFSLHFSADPKADEWRDEAGEPARITVFTTRPDTLFGATYLVLAPEHPWVTAALARGVLTNAEEVRSYVQATAQKTERERSENKEKTGVRLEGVSAINPATKEEIPLYAADYVLASYGTGAVMAVPAHDERDFEFAKKFTLPLRQVVIPQVTDLGNPPQEGKENTFRKLIIAVLRDPKSNEYLCLRWKKQPWTTFITGGIEDGEDPIEAAKREIVEETGYTDLAFVRALGGVNESRFYAAHKGVNRTVHSQALLFDLLGGARTEVDAAESEQFDIVRIKEHDLPRAGLQHGEFEFIWRALTQGEYAYAGPGILLNSGEFDGHRSEDAKWEIVEAVGGERTTNYRLRDWLVSRQRYWGCPIPVAYDPSGVPHTIPPEHLPWLLPTDVDFHPNEKGSPLASSKELKERVESIFGEGWTPEYDTLDTFVDSSWYYLRYLDPHENEDFSSASLMKRWMPIDRYSGGSEHTTMHLLYARFFYKALDDLALVPGSEPFRERFNRGLIMGPDGQKMSKSKGNVLNPDEFVSKFGSDAVRLYLAFIGPYNEPGTYPWNLDGVASMRKFLERVVRMTGRAEEAGSRVRTAQASAKVAVDCERFKFNTAVAALMTLLNTFEQEPAISKESAREFLILLAPFAPHLAEHLWEELGGGGSVHAEPWPEADAALPEGEATEVAVQVNGKKRGTLKLPSTASEEEALMKARKLAAVISALAGREPARVVYVPGRVLNLVI